MNRKIGPLAVFVGLFAVAVPGYCGASDGNLRALEGLTAQEEVSVPNIKPSEPQKTKETFSVLREFDADFPFRCMPAEHAAKQRILQICVMQSESDQACKVDQVTSYLSNGCTVKVSASAPVARGAKIFRSVKDGDGNFPGLTNFPGGCPSSEDAAKKEAMTSCLANCGGECVEVQTVSRVKDYYVSDKASYPEDKVAAADKRCISVSKVKCVDR